jgi:lysyl-tRNA synthetase class 2
MNDKVEDFCEQNFEQSSKKEYDVRQDKLKSWKSNYNFSYQNHFRPTALSADLQNEFENQLPDVEKKFSLAGRIIFKRVMGKAAFFSLQDRKGKMQVYGRLQELGQEAIDLFKTLDIGDFIYVVGFLFRTRTGELTLHVEKFDLVNKSLRPLPEKFHGISDSEYQYRHRYVDLIVTEQSKKVFKFRSELIHFLREFFVKKDYMEVETPMMQTVPGGANAKPFVTHHNALGRDLYLRIAPELFLKRLVVGGFERVFEINRNFRNEGLSTKHNPEFTMIEFYQSYADYKDLMRLTEELFQEIIHRFPHCAHVSAHDDQIIDLSSKFRKMTLEESLIQVAGLSEDQARDKDFLQTKLQKEGSTLSLGVILLKFHL